MIQPFAIRARIAITLTLLFVMVTPVANTAWAQTPESPTEPPVVTEVATEVSLPPVETATEVVPPPVETATETAPPVETATEVDPPPVETATETVPPVETATEVAPPPAETATEVTTQPTETATEVVETPTEEVAAPTETEVADNGESTPTAETEASTPTPTEEVIVPDQLTLISAALLEIGPGQAQDVTVRYTLGSDREKTEVSVNLAAPGGESLEGWSIAPVNRGDTLEDPVDPNRTYKAGIDEAGAVQRENTFDVTWRLTAPAHIEKPISLRLSFAGEIHREDGVNAGANMPNLVTANAVASVHAPTLNCIAGVVNNWNCTFDTTHPVDDVTIKASAVVPIGWELKVNDTAMLTEIAAPMDATVANTGAFTLTSDYPIGCPDKSASTNSTLKLELTYPSGEIATNTQDLTFAFEQPNPTLSVTSFEFNEFNMLETLSTTGSLTVAYADAPCDWVATIQIADLHTDTYTVTDANISIVATDGRTDTSVTIADGVITIQAPESASDEASGEITIHLQIDLPHQIPPGAYVIGVVTEFRWRDEI